MRNNFADKVQWHRYINYELHFAARELVKTLPAEQIAELALVVDERLPFPLLNMLGATYDNWLPQEIQTILISFPKGVWNLLNPFYLSDVGWAGFQILWANLPEPVVTECDDCQKPDTSKRLYEVTQNDLRKFTVIAHALKAAIIKPAVIQRNNVCV